MIGSIRDDEKFKKVYAEERQNFLKEFPTNERNHINYFIADEAIKGRPDQGKKETIAKSVAQVNSECSDTVCNNFGHFQFFAKLPILSHKALTSYIINNII